LKGFKDANEKRAAERAEAQSKTDAEKALKLEKDRLEKVRELEEQSAERLLKARAGYYEEGSDERVKAELEAIATSEANEIAAAKRIGASTTEISKYWAGERAKAIATAGETKTEKKKREEVAEFDPRSGDEVEKFAAAHQEELTRILEEGLIKRLELVRDLSPEGSQERLDAEAALQRKQLEVRTNQEVRAAKKQKDLVLALKQAEALGLSQIDAWQTKQGQMNAEQRVQTLLGTVGQTAQALGGLFAQHKGFAIAMAIINTAAGITEIWASKGTTGNGIADMAIKIMQTAIVAASGAAQISAIRNANINGAGSAPSSAASNPTSAAANPSRPPEASAPPPSPQSAPAAARTSSAPPPTTPPMTTAQLSAALVPFAALIAPAPRSITLQPLSATVPGGPGSSGRNMPPQVTNVVNIGTAFGDRHSMTKLAREINRVNANNQSVIR